MLNLKEGIKLSKNTRIVYEFFRSNPCKAFNVNELLEVINKNEQIMSRRTMFRALKKLTDIGRIHCCDICKGMRSFALQKSNYYVMNCDKCGLKSLGEISDEDIMQDILSFKSDFSIKRLSIDIRGTCKNCC